jgi:hypothetical protein
MLARRPWRLLVGIWGAYWLVLAAFVITPIVLAVRRASSAPPDQANAGVNFGNAGLSVTVVAQGQTLYSMSVSLIAMALWIAGPPLLAWLIVAAASRRAERREAASV